MKFQLSMEKPAMITTEVPVVKQIESGETSSKQSYKTVAIVSVAAVCITVAVVAGFLFAFKSHTEATADIIKRVIETNGIKETVEENLQENTKLFTIFLDNGDKQYMLYDFNRRMKIAKYDGRCMVSQMNHTEKDVEEMEEDDHNDMYQLDMTPVHDKSFLSKSAADLCEGSHVHWAFPQCGDNGASRVEELDDTTTAVGDKERTKRQTRIYGPIRSCVGSRYRWCFVDGCGRRFWSCRVVLYYICNGRVCFCRFYYGC